MNKQFSKTLLLCPKKYSLFNNFSQIIDIISEDIVGFDVRTGLKPSDLCIHAQMYRFPYKIRNRWETYFLAKINKVILEKYKQYQPELVWVYNSEFLLPETCALIKKNSKLVFFMGDSPFYTPINNFYLTCLTYADLILAPDSFWLAQLNTMGLNRTAFFVPGIDSDSYHVVTNQVELADIEETDILYTGMCYVDSWGYKKALLMSQFIHYNFKLYGNRMWKRWFRFFPELASHYTESGYIPTEQLNKMYNRSKIIPVDGNPAILNGFHIRLLEALGAGALPLVEHRKDITKLLFKGCTLIPPLIQDYHQAGDTAEYYIRNEAERKELIAGLRQFILKNYNAARNAERLIQKLKAFN